MLWLVNQELMMILHELNPPCHATRRSRLAIDKSVTRSFHGRTRWIFHGKGVLISFERPTDVNR